MLGRWEGGRLPQSANLRVEVVAELRENYVVERLLGGVALLLGEISDRFRAVRRIVGHLGAPQRVTERRVGLLGTRTRATTTEKSILARQA